MTIEEKSVSERLYSICISYLSEIQILTTLLKFFFHYLFMLQASSTRLSNPKILSHLIGVTYKFM